MRIRYFISATCLVATQIPVVAQEFPVGPNERIPAYAKRIHLENISSPAERFIPSDNALFNIMITGYWPPTNEMIREFSNNPTQNPGGWIGGNWEGRGYNVYAYFPEFPG